jgi:hypothetical protein
VFFICLACNIIHKSISSTSQCIKAIEFEIYEDCTWQNYSALYDLNILNCEKEEDIQALKPALFKSLTKHIAMIPRIFFPLTHQLKLERTSEMHVPCVHPVFLTTVQIVLECAYNDVI